MRLTLAIAGQAVALKVIGGTTVIYYLFNDHLGSVAKISTNGGSAVAGSTARYFPFGGWRSEPTSGLTDQGFTGHRHNNLGTAPDDIGLIYMNARWYLPGLARFISADTLVPNPTNPQSLNRYSYVRNSPLLYTDPTGHRECEGGDASCVIPPPAQHPGLPVPKEYNKGGANPLDFRHVLSEPDITDGRDFIGHPNAVDYAEAEGTSIYSSTLGIVVASSGCRLGNCVGQWNSNRDERQTAANNGYGNMILIEYGYDVLPDEVREVYGLQQGESLYALYAHMVAPSSLKAGNIVHSGDEIGNVGNTGHSDGNHLHVEMRVGPSKQIFTTGHFCEVSCDDTDARNTWFDLEVVDPELGWQ